MRAQTFVRPQCTSVCEHPMRSSTPSIVNCGRCCCQELIILQIILHFFGCSHHTPSYQVRDAPKTHTDTDDSVVVGMGRVGSLWPEHSHFLLRCADNPLSCQGNHGANSTVTSNSWFWWQHVRPRSWHHGGGAMTPHVCACVWVSICA